MNFIQTLAIALLLLAFSVCGTVTLASAGDTAMSNIIITRKNSVEPATGPESVFTGDVSVEFSVPRRGESRLSGGFVTFQPKARSNWHTHPYGQLLIIATGKGRVQEWGQPVQEVFSGDLVWFPAGVKHWHGAAPDQAMSHYAIQEEQDGQAANWMEKVTDAQYNGQ